jgi:hypothetical protein
MKPPTPHTNPINTHPAVALQCHCFQQYHGCRSILNQNFPMRNPPLKSSPIESPAPSCVYSYEVTL